MNAAVGFDSGQKWDVLELLTLLNGKGQQYEIGRGGMSKITALDVAASLAGLPDHIHRYAYLLAGAALRPADTRRVGNQLKTLVMGEMMQSKVAPKVATLPAMAEGVARCALVQRLKAKGNCAKCEGRGWVRADVHKLQCDKCEGSGRAVYTLKDCVELMGVGITVQSYQQTWQRFADFGLSELYTWDNLIRDKLRGLASA